MWGSGRKNGAMAMRVLIIACDPDLGLIWGRHLRRRGAEVTVAPTQESAIAALCEQDFDVMVIDVVLTEGSAIAIADFASYRRPGTKVVFVSNGGFFSDGSLFQHIPNAAAVMPGKVSPEDLEAVVEYHGAA